MVFDLHNDLPTLNSTMEEKIKIYEAYDENEPILAFWTTRIKNPIEFINSTIDRFSVYFGANYTSSSNNPPRLKFAIEDCWFLNTENIEDFIRYPFMYYTLTWNYENPLAAGADSDSGLTSLGRQVLKILNENSLILDTAHLSNRSFYQAVEINDKIINSHTCLHCITPHRRNLDDSQIKIIIEKNGIIGLTIVESFLGGNTVDDYIRQIDTFVQRYGANNLAIGTDFNGTDPIEGLADYNCLNALSERLSKKGYSNTDIANILYANAKNYFRSQGRL